MPSGRIGGSGGALRRAVGAGGGAVGGGLDLLAGLALVALGGRVLVDALRADRGLVQHVVPRLVAVGAGNLGHGVLLGSGVPPLPRSPPGRRGFARGERGDRSSSAVRSSAGGEGSPGGA